MNAQLLQQARDLGVDEQIELVGAIWDGIVTRDAVPPLTDAQKWSWIADLQTFSLTLMTFCRGAK